LNIAAHTKHTREINKQQATNSLHHYLYVTFM